MLTTLNRNQACIPQILEDMYNKMPGFKNTQCGQAYFATIMITRNANNEALIQ